MGGSSSVVGGTPSTPASSLSSPRCIRSSRSTTPPPPPRNAVTPRHGASARCCNRSRERDDRLRHPSRQRPGFLLVLRQFGAALRARLRRWSEHRLPGFALAVLEDDAGGEPCDGPTYRAVGDRVADGTAEPDAGGLGAVLLPRVTPAYRAVDAHVRHRLRRWLRNKHKCGGRATKRFPNEFLYGTLGLVRLEQMTRDLPWAKA